MNSKTLWFNNFCFFNMYYIDLNLGDDVSNNIATTNYCTKQYIIVKDGQSTIKISDP